MDEMTLGSHKYVSTKRAAKITGYAQDYVGQLVRQGKLKATKVGKGWFVLEDEALRLAGKPAALESPERAIALLERKRTITKTESVVSVSVEYPKTWSSVHYFKDESPLLPISDSRESIVNKSEIEILDEHRVRISKLRPAADHRSSGAFDSESEEILGIGPVRMSSFDGVRYSAGPMNVNPVTRTKSGGKRVMSDGKGDVVTESARSFMIEDRHAGTVRGVSFLGSFFRIFVSAFLVSLLVFLIPIFG